MTTTTTAVGLEGVEVARTRLSHVDGQRGELVIAGFPVEELAPNATFEQTLHLLWAGDLPTGRELRDFQQELRRHRELPPGTEDTLRAAAAQKAPPMDALRMAAATLSLGTPPGEADPRSDAIRVVARLPTALAAYARLLGGADPIPPRPDLGHAANLLFMLEGEAPDRDRARGLETYLNTMVDHGLNASTFTARVIVSTESDVVSAVTGAIGALKGRLHGGAPGPVLEMMEEVHRTGDPEGYVRTRLQEGERIMGFGHRVYKVRDPRAEVLGAAAEQFFQSGGDSSFYESARRLEEVAVKLLDEHKPGRSLRTNVEFYTALLLRGIGLPASLFSPIFAVARAGGWTAHSLEQLASNRLIRPSATYIGETGRRWPSQM